MAITVTALFADGTRKCEFQDDALELSLMDGICDVGMGRYTNHYGVRRHQVTSLAHRDRSVIFDAVTLLTAPIPGEGWVEL